MAETLCNIIYMSWRELGLSTIGKQTLYVSRKRNSDYATTSYHPVILKLIYKEIIA